MRGFIRFAMKYGQTTSASPPRVKKPSNVGGLLRGKPKPRGKSGCGGCP